jgi:hypothetical protein
MSIWPSPRFGHQVSHIADWSYDAVAEYDAHTDARRITWRAWHCCIYTYERLADPLHGIDLLRIAPDHERSGKVWVSDHPFAFADAMMEAVSRMFGHADDAGRLYMVRPGVPKTASFYRIPLYGRRVNVVELLGLHGGRS